MSNKTLTSLEKLKLIELAIKHLKESKSSLEDRIANLESQKEQLKGDIQNENRS